MSKTAVYSWRVDPDLKRRLEAAARAEKTSVGGLLDRIARAWLNGARPGEDDAAVQRRLHAQVAKVIGTIRLGEGPYTRARVRERIRASLMEKRRRPLRDAPSRSG
jgi:hypothetical protein